MYGMEVVVVSSAKVSNKGQITLPAAMRRKLSIRPNSRVDIELRDDEIVVRPLRSVSELRGVFRHCATGGPMDWEEARTAAGRTVAEQVANE